MGAVLRIFRGNLTLPVIALFVFGSAILVITNMYGIAKLQLAFRIANASLAIPIQQIPMYQDLVFYCFHSCPHLSL